jgi:hypothetical protein
MRRRIPPAFVVVIVLLLIVGRVLHQQGFNQHQPDTTNTINPSPRDRTSTVLLQPALSLASTAETLTKYGNPVPHKLVGPYHVLVNRATSQGTMLVSKTHVGWKLDSSP